VSNLSVRGRQLLREAGLLASSGVLVNDTLGRSLVQSGKSLAQESSGILRAQSLPVLTDSRPEAGLDHLIARGALDRDQRALLSGLRISQFLTSNVVILACVGLPCKGICAAGISFVARPH
jgi:hypothetical protein